MPLKDEQSPSLSFFHFKMLESIFNRASAKLVTVYKLAFTISHIAIRCFASFIELLELAIFHMTIYSRFDIIDLETIKMRN